MYTNVTVGWFYILWHCWIHVISSRHSWKQTEGSWRGCGWRGWVFGWWPSRRVLEVTDETLNSTFATSTHYINLIEAKWRVNKRKLFTKTTEYECCLDEYEYEYEASCRLLRVFMNSRKQCLVSEVWDISGGPGGSESGDLRTKCSEDPLGCTEWGTSPVWRIVGNGADFPGMRDPTVTTDQPFSVFTDTGCFWKQPILIEACSLAMPEIPSCCMRTQVISWKNGWRATALWDLYSG